MTDPARPEEVHRFASKRVHGSVRIDYESLWFDEMAYLALKNWSGSDAELQQSSHWHTINITIDGGTALTGARIAGELTYEGIDEPGSLTFIPAGADRHSWYSAADLAFVSIYLHPGLKKKLGGFPLVGEVAPRVNAKDPLLLALVSALAREIRLHGTLQAEIVEHSLSLIVARLLHYEASLDSKHAASPLDTRQTKLVSEYVDSNLSRKISLDDMADFLDIPLFTFAHSFKSSLGIAPYQYILRRRIRRAEYLLANTNLPIASIAYDTGFASQSHLTTAFKKHAGLPPNAYRKSKRTTSASE